METFSISLSGPAFSFLIYENLKTSHFQEGFLLGEIVQTETKIITDSDKQQLRISRVIKINSAVPCPKTHHFYDAIGHINSDKIDSLLGELSSKVVAWYKYKPVSSFNFTLRERLIHQQLIKLFKVPPELFSCCILTSEASHNASTYSHTQTFLTLGPKGEAPLPVHINNLSDPHNNYKTADHVSDSFQQILQKLNLDQEVQGLPIIKLVENALETHTSDIVNQLSEAEKRLFQLEAEVRDLTLTNLIVSTCQGKKLTSENRTSPRGKKGARGRVKSVTAGGDTKPTAVINKRNVDEPVETTTRLRKRN